MPLDHHFGIIVADPAKPWDRTWWKKSDYSTLLSLMLKPVSVHDDLLSYLVDTLAWIPCYNPHRGLNHFGLNLHGTTLINSQGTGIAASIFDAWARLFQFGPPRLHLTGNYTIRVGAKKPQAYAKLRLPREEVVAKISALALQCHEVERAPNGRFVLHLGI